MRKIRKRIVRDEADQPVAVQIDYADWLAIEQLLNQQSPGRRPTDLSSYDGILPASVDPIEYQRQVRAEWP